MTPITRQVVKDIFSLAGIGINGIEPLIDGYSFTPEDPRFYQTPPRCAWWFVRTSAGWIKIGQREKVVVIDWTYTDFRKVVTSDDVTKSQSDVHAWSVTKAIEYLRALFSPHVFYEGVKDDPTSSG